MDMNGPLKAKHMKQLRKAKKIPLSTFAKQVGIPLTQMARYEQGEGMFAETAFRIANALDTTIYHLCGLSDDDILA